MLVSDFDFDLPDELIAQTAAPRGESRLLVLDKASDGLSHRSIADLPGLLRPGDLLVVNNTRVFAARLLGHRVPTGGAVECLLLSQRVPAESGEWEALMHPGQKLKPGAVVRFQGPAGVLMGEVLERRFQGRRTIRLWTESESGVMALIDALGHVPLPPYIRRDDSPADRERYQTVFARERGSIAAPTAGLHFTTRVARRPHREWRSSARKSRCTSATAPSNRSQSIGSKNTLSIPSATRSVSPPRPPSSGRDRMAGVSSLSERQPQGHWKMLRGGAQALSTPDTGSADLFIYPGFVFQVVNGLLTNFHLPKSSLLMLVCAFAGRDAVLEAYRTAVEHRYRFYSYGDAMLVV